MRCRFDTILIVAAPMLFMTAAGRYEQPAAQVLQAEDRRYLDSVASAELTREAKRTFAMLLFCDPDAAFKINTAALPPGMKSMRSPQPRLFAKQPKMPPSARSGIDAFPWERTSLAASLQSIWKEVMVPALITLALGVVGLLPLSAMAENELAALAGGKFDSSLVDTQCIKNSCALQSAAAIGNPDSLKGMACIGKCMGDNACVTGCFAKFGNGNEEVSELLKCTVEDNECIKINVLPKGPDPADAVTPPRGTLVKNFNPDSMQGTWYKVMGWNSNYDCFDCQQNTFKRARADGPMTVDVDFSMPRQRRFTDKPGTEPEPARLRMVEKMLFDKSSSNRHAHTEGRLFGLKFWENWAVIGENSKEEPPFKFIYYNGRTRQNTYEGAFVYARTPKLSPVAMKSVYNVAQNAGMDPTKFCQIRNSECHVQSTTGPSVIASSSKRAASILTAIVTAPIDGVHNAGMFLGDTAANIAEFTEDARDASKWMLDQQKLVDWGSIAYADDSIPLSGASNDISMTK
jgi:hypothetical protein